MAIRSTARSGISQCHLHVRSLMTGREFSSYHAVLFDLGCPHCRLSKYHKDTEVLVISITEHGTIQQDDGGTVTELDNLDVASDLPGLDSKLLNYAALVQGENSTPIVRIMVNDATPYQRLIDVLCQLHDHGLEPEWTDSNDKIESVHSGGDHLK